MEKIRLAWLSVRALFLMNVGLAYITDEVFFQDIPMTY